jgi:hypothetical protein
MVVSIAVSAQPVPDGKIGAEIVIRMDSVLGHSIVWIKRVVPGGPAALAGLRESDHLISIGKKSTAGITLTDAISTLGGQPGTLVPVCYTRQGQQLRCVDIKRAGTAAAAGLTGAPSAESRNITTLSGAMAAIIPHTGTRFQAIKGKLSRSDEYMDEYAVKLPDLPGTTSNFISQNRISGDTSYEAVIASRISADKAKELTEAWKTQLEQVLGIDARRINDTTGRSGERRITFSKRKEYVVVLHNISYDDGQQVRISITPWSAMDELLENLGQFRK